MRPSERAELRRAFGERVRSLRIRKGQSREDLARACRLSSRAISRVERGEANPDLERLVALSRGLGVPLKELIGPPPGQFGA